MIFLPGSKLSIGTLGHLTFEQAPEAIAYQIFSITGTGSVKVRGIVYPDWFGVVGGTDDTNTVIAAQTAGDAIKFAASKTYNINSVLTLTKPTSFEDNSTMNIEGSGQVTFSFSPEAGPYKFFKIATGGTLTIEASGLAEWFGAGDGVTGDAVAITTALKH